MLWYTCTLFCVNCLWRPLQVISGLNRYPLAYLLLTELRWNGRHDDKNAGDDPMMKLKAVNCVKYRPVFHGTLIAGGGFTPKSAKDTIDAGHCDVRVV